MTTRNPVLATRGVSLALLTILAGNAAAERYFPDASIWTRDWSNSAVRSDSAQILARLEQDGGWGAGGMRVDFSIDVLHADESLQPTPFIPNGDHYGEPPCDLDPIPLPPGGAVEGEAGYTCTQGGDCHLLVVQGRKLFETWRASMEPGGFESGCLAVWDLDRTYSVKGRGQQCTSADAAGFPIAPLLFTADEVIAGEIDHAIRFILPNNRMRASAYVAPATHAGAPSNPNALAIPYGSHLRLRANYPLASLPSEGARVVARAMQRYGMFLSDGGNIALTARGDRFTEGKWDGVLDTYDLSALEPSDFEILDHGSNISLTRDCEFLPRDTLFDESFDLLGVRDVTAMENSND